jgi:hypothetical protein
MSKTSAGARRPANLLFWRLNVRQFERNGSDENRVNQ